MKKKGGRSIMPIGIASKRKLHKPAGVVSRKCRECGKDAWPNYFFCSECHAKKSKDLDPGFVAWSSSSGREAAGNYNRRHVPGGRALSRPGQSSGEMGIIGFGGMVTLTRDK